MTNIPDTSLAAYDQVTPEALRDIYDKILLALRELGKANYETIAQYLKLNEPNIISRRLKEMRDMEPPLIYKTGSKSLTSRNRLAYDHSVISSDTEVPPVERITKGQFSVADYANKLLAATAKGIKIQAALFNEQ